MGGQSKEMTVLKLKLINHHNELDGLSVEISLGEMVLVSASEKIRELLSSQSGIQGASPQKRQAPISSVTNE